MKFFETLLHFRAVTSDCRWNKHESHAFPLALLHLDSQTQDMSYVIHLKRLMCFGG